MPEDHGHWGWRCVVTGRVDLEYPVLPALHDTLLALLYGTARLAASQVSSSCSPGWTPAPPPPLHRTTYLNAAREGAFLFSSGIVQTHGGTCARTHTTQHMHVGSVNTTHTIHVFLSRVSCCVLPTQQARTHYQMS